ncbi:MAG: FHA domain-containing protein [bacterium]
MREKITLTEGELYSPEVDEIVAEQQARARAMPSFEPTPLWRRVLFSSLFFLSVAGLLGGLTGWAILEPLHNEGFTRWGTIQDVQLPAGDTQTRILKVRDLPFLATPSITRVAGRGEYEDIAGVDDLRVGLPVRLQGALPSGQAQPLWATRIVVQPIPPGREDEPLPDFQPTTTEVVVGGFFGFAIVGTCIAAFVAAADGVMSRNLRRGLLSGLCGVGIASVGSTIMQFVGGLVFYLGSRLASEMSEEMWTSATVTGWPLLILMVGRSLAWGLIGATVGLGQGAAMRSGKLLINGLLGGMLGALLGGVFFEPICKLFANTDLSGQAAVSRAVGFSLIGLSAGLMIGLVEHLAKDAWLLMRAGPLTGKQFVIYKDPTAIGSSPKCEIYLFKDPDVEPRHALIHHSGSRHEIQDLKAPAGTHVNGQRVTRHTLHDGDQILIGQTVLEYSERARGHPS